METIVREHISHFLRYMVVQQLGGGGVMLLLFFFTFFLLYLLIFYTSCVITYVISSVLLKIAETSYNNYIFSIVLCKSLYFYY